MSNLKVALLVVLVAAVCSDKILAILDSKDLEKTHSTFFSLLTQGGQHQVEFAHSFGKSNIELKYYDRFRYDHIVVFCTSDKGTPPNTQKSTAASRPETSSPTSTREAT